MTTILGLDTTHGVCSVAVFKDGTIIAQAKHDIASEQSEVLFSLLDDVLAESKLTYPDIDHVAVSIGPGSFTGVRIGLAAAHGIHLASKIPLIGITTLEALAHASSPKQDITILLDAKRQQLFGQCFDTTLAPLTPPSLIALEQARAFLQEGVLVGGNGIALIKEIISGYRLDETLTLPNAAMVAECAYYKLSHGHPTEPALPLYIRKPDAKLPKKETYDG